MFRPTRKGDNFLQILDKKNQFCSQRSKRSLNSLCIINYFDNMQDVEHGTDSFVYNIKIYTFFPRYLFKDSKKILNLLPKNYNCLYFTC